MNPAPATISIPDIGEVSAVTMTPDNARAMYVFAHGAGAGMNHVFMDAMAQRLAARAIATLRYNFPYMQQRGRRPDSPKKLTAAVRSAIQHAKKLAPDLPIFAGGKSMGGRMTSTALAEQPDDAVRGIIFIGFPLHPSASPGTSRAKHLADIKPPMLFLQGTRDKLADLESLTAIVDDLPSGTIHIVDGADHGFHVLKRSGRTDEQVLDELAHITSAFVDTHRNS